MFNWPFKSFVIIGAFVVAASVLLVMSPNWRSALVQQSYYGPSTTMWKHQLQLGAHGNTYGPSAFQSKPFDQQAAEAFCAANGASVAAFDVRPGPFLDVTCIKK
jgi:hypothetical protein